MPACAAPARPARRALTPARARLLAWMALATGALVALPAAPAATEEGVKGFYRQPALRGNQVVFVAEGDLWRVALGGGRAERLTTHPGQEAWPALSPDGRWLAFVGSHDGGADAYVMPSRQEGFGFVHLEAMACGIPAVASSVDGAREAVRDGQIGRLIDPEDRDAIVRETIAALDQPKAVPDGLSFFGYEKFAARVNDLVRSVCGRGR